MCAQPFYQSQHKAVLTSSWYSDDLLQSSLSHYVDLSGVILPYAVTPRPSNFAASVVDGLFDVAAPVLSN